MIFEDLMMKHTTLYPNLKFSLKSSSFKRHLRVKTTKTFPGLTSPNSLNRTCLQFYILFDLTNDILVLKNNVGEGENLCHSAQCLLISDRMSPKRPASGNACGAMLISSVDMGKLPTVGGVYS